MPARWGSTGSTREQPARQRHATLSDRPHGEGARVGGQQRAFLVLPCEKVLGSGPARSAHRSAALRVIEQLGDQSRKAGVIARRGEYGSLTGAKPATP